MRECPSCGAIEKGDICSFCEYEFIKKKKTVALTTPLQKANIKEESPLKKIIWIFTSLLFFFMGIGAANTEGDGLPAFVSFLISGLCAYSAFKQKTKNKIIVRIAFVVLIVLWIVSID